MKRFLTWYIVISVFIGVLIYFYASTVTYNERLYEVFYNLAETSVEKENFDEFISFQSKYYKKLSVIEENDYRFETYLIISRDSNDSRSQLGIFVLPLKDVTYATDIKDENDHTGMRLIETNTQELIYETYLDSAYNDIAISYGISLMDFYYYAVDLKEDAKITIELYDYEQNKIATILEDITLVDQKDIDDSYQIGLTNDQLDELVDKKSTVYPTIIRYMSIYVLTISLIGSGLYVLKKRKLEKNNH